MQNALLVGEASFLCLGPCHGRGVVPVLNSVDEVDHPRSVCQTTLDTETVNAKRPEKDRSMNVTILSFKSIINMS